MSVDTYYDTLRQRFLAATPHSTECGMQLTDVSEHGVTALLPFREEWIGDLQRQIIHTGIIITLVDTTCGAAVFAALRRYEPIATLDLRLDYLRPSQRDLPLHCRAECHRLTTSIAFARASVWQDDPDAPVAVAQGAFMRSSARKPVERTS